MRTARIQLNGSSRVAIATAGLAFIIASACATAGGDTPVVEGSPEGSPTPTETALPVPTRTPTPVATVDAAESIGYYSAAYNLLSLGKYVDAERRFSQVVELEPDFARGWDGLGQANLLLGDYEEAMFDFDRAIALKPNLAQAYSHRAMVRIWTDDSDGARRDAEQALEMDPESVDAYLVMGRVYARAADYQDSFDSFNRAIELAPDSAGTWLWRGRFYRDVIGDYARALADLSKAIELEPSQASLYVDRALLYSQWAQIDLARSDLEEALSLSSDPALASIHDQAQQMLDQLKQRYPTATPGTGVPFT